MTCNDPLVNAERAARRYWNVDGLAEIYAGCFFLLVPLASFSLRRVSIAPVWLALAGIVVLVCSLALSRTVITVIRRRLTYPRTGYVSFRRARRGETVGIGVILISLLAILILMALTTNWSGGLTAISGLAIGLLDIHFGRMTGMPRFYFLGGLSIAAGTLLGLAEPTFTVFFPMGAFALLLGIIGAGYLVTGGITLWKYLGENPAPSQEHA
jgi:hypothetical protein